MSSSESAPPPKSSSSSTKSTSSPPPPSTKSAQSPPPPSKSSHSPPPPPAKSSQSPPPPAKSARSPPPPAKSAQSPPPPAEAAAKSPPPPPPQAAQSTTTPAAVPAGTLAPPPPPRASSKKEAATTGNTSGLNDMDTRILIGVVAGTGLLILFIVSLICCACCCRKKKKKMYHGEDHMQYYGNGSQPYNTSSQKKWQNSEHALQMPPHHGSGWGPPSAPQGYMSSDMSSNLSSPQSLAPGMMPPPPPPLGGFNRNAFTYEELMAATGGFSQANLLGQGGFGFVHKGVLPNGTEVAVKSLKSGSGQGEREFQAEVEIISRVHHRHLVSLVGYCIAGQQRMLVYEFVPNNTLEFHLHGKGRPPMEWSTRVKIATGSAKGLAYLHEDCHPRIIHRDIKTANILIENNFDAKVADFGLAKLSSDTSTHVSTRIMGTFGYLAPEYASSGKLTEKSDVYSYGVMLLELITGRPPVDYTGEMEDSLAEWARPLLQTALEEGNCNEFVDPRLENNFDPHEMRRMVACAAASIRHSARRRPKMSQIVRALEGDVSLDDLNEGMMKPGQSGMFKSDGSSGSSSDLRKYRKTATEESQGYASSEFGMTSEYGLNPSSSSSDSTESGQVVNQKPISSL